MSVRLSVERLRPVRAGEEGSRAALRSRPGAEVAPGVARSGPRDAGGILDLAIEGLVARFGPCFALAFAVWLPFLQIQELLGLSALGEFELQLTGLAWQLFQFVPAGITTSVVASLVADTLADPAAAVLPGLLRGLRRAPGVCAVLALSALVQFATLVALFFLCGLGVLVGQWLTFAAAPAYALEDRTRVERVRASRLPTPLRRVFAALGRSVALARASSSLGRWALVALVGSLLLAFALDSGATALMTPESRSAVSDLLGLGGTASGFFLAACAAAFTALAACVRAALMTAFYLDLCVRHEGHDLALELARRTPHAEDA